MAPSVYNGAPRQFEATQDTQKLIIHFHIEKMNISFHFKTHVYTPFNYTQK